MIDAFLQVGQKVNIKITRGEKKFYFSSKIEDITSKHILLGMPMKAGVTFNTFITEKIEVYFSRKDSFYCLDCDVEEKRYIPIPILVVKPINFPYKHQKRRYFRLKISLKVNIKMVENDEWLDGYTTDISAGGAMVSFKQDIKNDSFVDIKIPAILGNQVFKAKVIRSEKDYMREINPYDIALQFIELEEIQRDGIVKILLEKQRKLRKKGLI